VGSRGRTDGAPLYRNRAFVILWTGGIVSGTGSSMSTLVFPLVGFALTGSTFLAGLAATGVLVGELLGRLVSGPLVDRWPKRSAIVVTNTVAAVAMASVAVASLAQWLTLAHLLVAGLAIGLAEAFLAPAVSASIRHVVPVDQLPVAYTRLQVRQHLAELVGPPLGGALYAIGRSVPFVVDAVSYLAFAILAVRLPAALRTRGRSAGSFLGDAREGFAFVWRHGAVRAILLWGGLFNFAMAYVVTAVTLRLVQAGVPAVAIGLVSTVAAVAGLLGAVAAGRIVPRFRTGLLTITTGAVLALIVAPMGLTTNVVVIGALFAAGIVLLPANNSGISAYIATVTPPELQARVNAAAGVLSLGPAPLAPPLAGALIAAVGGPGSMLVGSALLVVSLLPLVVNHEVRSLGKPTAWGARTSR
jgi:MFS family permease